MSKENLARFMSKVADSEELQAKIGEEIDAEALIALGAECGCDFSTEDLSEAAELSDDELASIAGGITEILPILTEARLVIDGNTSILKFSRGIHKTPPSISYGTPSSGD